MCLDYFFYVKCWDLYSAINTLNAGKFLFVLFVGDNFVDSWGPGLPLKKGVYKRFVCRECRGRHFYEKRGETEIQTAATSELASLQSGC